MKSPSGKIVNPLWTIEQLAEFLKVNNSIIRYWIRMKTLPHIKLGRQTRFDPEDIIKWLSTHKSVPYSDDSKGELKRIS